ncbi:hypothetical protein A4F85_01100 [Delftia sp. GW456-R20]|nr:hypothetical protein A4F85_01100 [Delftia sp. GW456-R20]
MNVSHRLDVRAYELLLEQAAAARMSTRAWLESAILSNSTTVVLPPDEELIRAMLFQVSRAGNNLNQIAHKLNALDMAGRLTPERFEKAMARLESIHQLLEWAVLRAGKN